jgi:hypothetical protein
MSSVKTKNWSKMDATLATAQQIGGFISPCRAAPTTVELEQAQRHIAPCEYVLAAGLFEYWLTMAL